MRGQNAVLELAQRADKLITVGPWLNREHINGGAVQVLVAQGGGQGVDINYGAARGVNQNAALLDCADFLLAHHPLGGCGFRYVQGDDVSHAQQLSQ